MGENDKNTGTDHVNQDLGMKAFDPILHADLEESVSLGKKRMELVLSSNIKSLERVKFDRDPYISHIEVLSSSERRIGAGTLNLVSEIKKGDIIDVTLGRKSHKQEVSEIFESGNAYLFRVKGFGGSPDMLFITKKES